MFFYKVMAFVAISGVYPALVCVIVSRSVSNRVASAVRSGCVRRPIGLRSPSNRVASAVRSDSVRVTMR